MKKIISLMFLVCILSPVTVLGQEKASLPYQMVWQYFTLFDSLAHLQLIKPSINITSIDSNVPPTDIEFRINVSGAWVNFSPDPTGGMDFPREPSWAERNLVLISNQPKGTLELQIGFSAIALPPNPVPYQHLVDIQKQFEEAMSVLADTTGQTAPAIKGLTLLMPEGASFEIQAQRNRIYKPNGAGIVNLPFDAALGKANPPVVFSAPPLGIIPLQKSRN